MAMGLSLDKVRPDAKDGVTLDDCLAEWCDQEFFEGYPGSRGDQMWAAISVWWPEVSRKGSITLPRFARARQAWNSLSPRRTRDPLTLMETLLIASWMFQHGLKLMALAILVAFTGYLRPSELLTLRCSDLLRPSVSSRYFSLMLFPEEQEVP